MSIIVVIIVAFAVSMLTCLITLPNACKAESAVRQKKTELSQKERRFDRRIENLKEDWKRLKEQDFWMCKDTLDEQRKFMTNVKARDKQQDDKLEQLKDEQDAKLRALQEQITSMVILLNTLSNQTQTHSNGKS